MLRLKGIDVLAVENRDETDRNERFYFISRPNEKYLWRENGGIPYCPQCYERITKKWTDEGVSFTPEEVIAKCSAKLDDKGKVKGYCGIKIREVKDLPFHDRLSVITLLQNDYRCSNRYVDEHGRSRECGCRYTPPHPFYKKGQQYTDRYARALGDASLTKKSFQQVAYDFHTTDRTVIKYFEEEIKRRKEECKFETPEHIGIDEAKVHTNERGGAFYVCVMNTDPDAPEKNGIIEFEKMKTMQPISAKVKMTRQAMSQGEVRFDVSAIVFNPAPGCSVRCWPAYPGSLRALHGYPRPEPPGRAPRTWGC